MNTSKPRKGHGGKRVGAGRPARFGVPMETKTIRLPPDWADRLAAEFGSLQTAIEALVSLHLARADSQSERSSAPD